MPWPGDLSSADSSEENGNQTTFDKATIVRVGGSSEVTPQAHSPTQGLSMPLRVATDELSEVLEQT